MAAYSTLGNQEYVFVRSITMSGMARKKAEKRIMLDILTDAAA